jgi:hypothetical protein
MIAAGSASLITEMDISSVIPGIDYIWTLNNLKNITAINNFYIGAIKGMPSSIVTMSLVQDNLSYLYPLNNTSASILSCQSNYLSSLPALPATMSYINCSNNNIITLPDPLPYGVTTLLADYNYILRTPSVLPATLVSMSISHNPSFTSWTAASPASLQWVNASYCPSIGSLPFIGSNFLYLNLQSDYLSEAAQGTIIQALVNNALTGGNLILYGNTIITNTGIISNLSTLASWGWTISRTL